MSDRYKILSVNTRTATPDDDLLPAFDNTKLVAVNTCPLWGILRYTHHKTMNASSRSMALEAGSAAHEAFAAHRLYELLEHGASFYNVQQSTIEKVFDQEMLRIFGERKYNDINAAVNSLESYRTRRNQFVLEALYSSGFYDDPFDKRRTLSNLEELVMAYCDTYSFKKMLPVVMPRDGTQFTDASVVSDLFVGVEIPVNVVVMITYCEHGDEDNPSVLVARLTGKADGIHYRDETKTVMRVHENKTASRLDDAWQQSFETNHQPTGYMIGVRTILQADITEALVLGTALPLPKNYSISGIIRVVVNRSDWQIAEWFRWFLHTVLLHNEFVDDVKNAPQYTHSCNRYFRPCSFIPLCATSPEDRDDFIADMQEQEWSPLHEENND